MSGFSIINLNQSYLIQLPARLSDSEADGFQEIFNQLCNVDSANRHIVLDFSHTESMGSSSIDVLLSIIKVAQKEKINIAFWSVNPKVEFQLSSASPELLVSIEDGTESLGINSQSSKNFIQEVAPIIKSIATRLNWKKLWIEKVQAAIDFHK